MRQTSQLEEAGACTGLPLTSKTSYSGLHICSRPFRAEPGPVRPVCACALRWLLRVDFLLTLALRLLHVSVLCASTFCRLSIDFPSTFYRCSRGTLTTHQLCRLFIDVRASIIYRRSIPRRKHATRLFRSRPQVWRDPKYMSALSRRSTASQRRAIVKHLRRLDLTGG